MTLTLFGSETYQELNTFLTEKNYSQIFLLVDENTHQLCLTHFLSELELEAHFEIIEIEAGETHKSIETAQGIWSALLELNADRKSLIINLGGGVVSDIGGFVASTFKRGIDFINVPTTLLAMVDAATGGKTGVNLDHSKNQVGTISFPEIVLIDPQFLHTLDKRELKSGFAEMLKHGLIANREHWDKLKQVKGVAVVTVSDLILDSNQIKQQVVNNDPTEKGLRKILNFGHTIGHAVESFYLNSEKPLLHGEAIGMGMILESKLSLDLGLLSKESYHEIYYYLSEFYQFKALKKEQIPSLLTLMKSDKKNERNQLKFCLLEGIGNAIFDVNVEVVSVKKVLEEFAI